jgi:hypothetical protein
MITPNGVLVRSPEGTEVLRAPDATQWDSVSTWADLTSYNLVPGQELRWITDVIDIGRPEYMVLETNIDCDGDVEYYMYSSNGGEFDGEETETVLNKTTDLAGSGNLGPYYGYAAFSGRFFRLGVKITGSAPVLRSLDWTLTSKFNMVYINDADSNGLNGDDEAGRNLYVGQTARLRNLQITSFSTLPYFADDYIADSYTALPKAPTAGILNKYQTYATIQFNNNGTTVSSEFDAAAMVLPEMFWEGKNIALRTPSPYDLNEPSVASNIAYEPGLWSNYIG